MRSVAVCCGSGHGNDPNYRRAARELGEKLARVGAHVLYGGSHRGLMGDLADGVLSQNGTITGVLPRSMAELELAHRSLTSLMIVESLNDRRELMLLRSSAIVLLAGGLGTLHELFEALMLKRLGQYTGDVVLVNTNEFFAPVIDVVERAIAEGFLGDQNRGLFSSVASPSEAVALLFPR